MKTVFTLEENAILNVCYTALPSQTKTDLLDQLNIFSELNKDPQLTFLPDLIHKVSSMTDMDFAHLQFPLPELDYTTEE